MLIEIIAGKHGPLEDDTVARVLEELYALGIKPDWWKLEPQASAAAWTNIGAVIDRHDPYCRGIVLLGLEAPEAAACQGLRRGRRPCTIGEGICRRPHDLQRCGAGLACGQDEATMTPIGAMAERFANLVAGGISAEDGPLKFGMTHEHHIRLTMAQALARFLTRQMTVIDGKKVPLFAGVWAIFGHGNVAGMGEALYGVTRRVADLSRP